MVDELEALMRCARSELHFGELVLTFSAGLAFARGPADHETAQAAARDAAKTAKESGRARVVVADQEDSPQSRPGR